MLQASKWIRLTIIIPLSISLTLFAADWPNWRGPNYDGISTEKDWDPLMLTDQTKPLWTAEVGTGFSSITVADGKAITLGNAKNKDTVFCFDAVTGKEIWSYTYDEPLTANLYEGGPNASATIADGKVYTVSKTGKAFCFTLDKGDVVWQKDLGSKKPEWGIAGSPVLLGDMLIYNASDKGVALNKTNGEIVWSSDSGQKCGYASAVPVTKAGKTHILMMGRDSLMCLEPQTGEMIWSYPWKTSYDINAADPVIVGDEIFVTSGYNHGCTLVSAANIKPEKVWENKNMRSQMSGPVAIGGYIYGFDDNKLACLDWKTGQVKWTDDSPAKGSLIAAGDKLIVLGEKGKLMIVRANPEKFSLISSAQVLEGKCWTPPTLANGRIYARNAKGLMVCVDVSIKKTVAMAEMVTVEPENPYWPQWKGPYQDNKSEDKGLLRQWPQDGPQMLWSLEGLGDGFSSVSIAHGLIYTTGMKNKEGFLTCLGLDGKQKWQKSYGPEWTKATPGVRGTPTIDNGKVYVISGVGQVACFDAASGDKLWQNDPFTEYQDKYGNWGIAQSAVIDGDKLFFIVGGAKATMVALNKNTGDTIWASKSIKDPSSYCTPVLFEHGGRKILAAFTSSHIIGVDAADGTILWTFATKDFAAKPKDIYPVTPVYKDGMLFCTSGYDQGSVMLELNKDGSAVKKVWINSDFDTHHGSVVQLDDYIYGTTWNGNGNGSWICVDWKTGKTMYETHWENKGSLTYADGMLYCYEEKNGNVALVKADCKEFKPISTFQITMGKGPHWGHPVVCGKRLYIRHGDVLMAFDIAAK